MILKSSHYCRQPTVTRLLALTLTHWRHKTQIYIFILETQWMATEMWHYHIWQRLLLSSCTFYPRGRAYANKPPSLCRSEIYRNSHTATCRCRKRRVLFQRLQWKRCSLIMQGFWKLGLGWGIIWARTWLVNWIYSSGACPKYLWGLIEVRCIWARTPCVLHVPQIGAAKGRELGHSVHFLSP